MTTINLDIGNGQTLVVDATITARVVGAEPVPTPTPTPVPTPMPTPGPTPIVPAPEPPVVNNDDAILSEAAAAIAKCRTLADLMALKETPAFHDWLSGTSENGRLDFDALFSNAEKLLQRVPVQPPLPPAPSPTPPPTPAPTMPPTQDGPWVEFSNPTADRIPARMVSFGQVFEQGYLKPGDTIDYCQVDAKTHWPDGSVKWAILTYQAMGLYAGDAEHILLLPMAPEPAPPLLWGMPNIAFRIATTSQSWDIPLNPAAADWHSSVWLSGPMAVQERRWKVVPLTSLRIIVDITQYADGTNCIDVTFATDVANTSDGADMTYDVEIVIEGRSAYTRTGVDHHQYQSWSTTLWSDGPPLHHVKHDIDYMQRAGAIMPFNLANPSQVNPDWAALARDPTWPAPLADGGIARNMGMTGGRPDIGPTTLHNALWLMRQTPDAKRIAIGQSEAGGSIPWHFRTSDGDLLMLGRTVPGDFWADGRGNHTLSQPTDDGGIGWAPDNAHQPNLHYHAALLSGRRRHLDLLQEQASWAIVSIWPDPRGYDKGLVLGWFDQIRAKAWDLREVLMAAYLSPDGTTESEYFRQIVQNNLEYVLSQRAKWKAADGETYGWISGDYGTPGVIPPWQEDFLYASFAMSRRMGFAGAAEMCDYMDNFIVGRWINLSPECCCTYNMPHPIGGWSELNDKMHGPYAWTLSDQTYLYTALMALSLSNHPDAGEAIRRALTHYADTQARSSELDKWTQFDFRRVG